MANKCRNSKHTSKWKRLLKCCRCFFFVHGKKRFLCFFSDSIFVGPVLRGYRRILQWLHCRLFDKNLRRQRIVEVEQKSDITLDAEAKFVKLTFPQKADSCTKKKETSSCARKKQAFILCFLDHSNIPLYSLYICLSIFVCVCDELFQKLFHNGTHKYEFYEPKFCALDRISARKKNALRKK